MFIIRDIGLPEQKYFNDIKHVTATADSPDLSDSVTELAYSMLKIIHATNGYWVLPLRRRIFLYIYQLTLLSQSARSACDQCKLILMPIINCIHLCLRSNI